MSYAARFSDDIVLRTPGTPPDSLPALLNDLGVRRADRDVQDAAVREWLTTHDAPAGLFRWELERRGLLTSA